MHDGGYMFLGGGLMWIFWIVILVGIVWVVKAAMTSNSSNSDNSNSSNNETPMEILKKRYANGDIDEQEYNRRRHELEK